MKKVLLLLLVICLGGGVYWYFSGTDKQENSINTLYGNEKIKQEYLP